MGISWSNSGGLSVFAPYVSLLEADRPGKDGQRRWDSLVSGDGVVKRIPYESGKFKVVLHQQWLVVSSFSCEEELFLCTCGMANTILTVFPLIGDREVN